MSIPVSRPLGQGEVFKAALIAVVLQAVLVTMTTLVKLRTGSEDTDFYYRYATMTLDGKVPYRDFRVEYPPLAIPLFLAAKLVSRGVVGFRVAFAIEMLIFNAGTVLVVARWVERRQGRARVTSSLAWYTLFFLMLSRLMISRYDAAPMLIGFGASVWWFSGREVLGGLAAAVGTLMKLYPALVALVASACESGASPDGTWEGLDRILIDLGARRRGLAVARRSAGGVGVPGVSARARLRVWEPLLRRRCWSRGLSVRRSRSSGTMPRGRQLPRGRLDWSPWSCRSSWRRASWSAACTSAAG